MLSTHLARIARHESFLATRLLSRRGIATTSRAPIALSHPHHLVQSDHKQAATKEAEPLLATRSFQPHPSDTPSLPPPSAIESPVHSRPHNDWVLHHPVYTPEDLFSVQVLHEPRKTITDHVASLMVKTARWGFDFVTRYKHASPEEAMEALKRDGMEGASLDVLRKGGYIMTERQWMQRILFLESVAGVPGMVASTIRHLRSLRMMERDGGWIHSLLEEAENERMHLMTFMKIRQPGKAFRFLVMATQGVFYNLFFLAYIISPKAAHRFVAYLEEEACVTYSQIVDEIKRGNIPEWSEGAQQVPQIAKDYWRLPDSSSMIDLVLAVRADEASHRFLNHTLSNLEASDHNPFGLKRPSAVMQGTLTGLTREESKVWGDGVENEMSKGEKRD